EDGIRDFHVTGVQTCALPISPAFGPRALEHDAMAAIGVTGLELDRFFAPQPERVLQREAHTHMWITDTIHVVPEFPRLVLVGDGESAALIKIEACRIALACVYAHAVEAVQGRTACACRTATLRRPRASSLRRDTRATGRSRRCSIGSWPSTIRSSGIGAPPRSGRCRAMSRTSLRRI